MKSGEKKKTSGSVKGFEMLAVAQVRKKCLNSQILNDNNNNNKHLLPGNDSVSDDIQKWWKSFTMTR